MPPTHAVRWAGSTRRTWPNAETSRPAREAATAWAAWALRSLLVPEPWPAVRAPPAARPRRPHAAWPPRAHACRQSCGILPVKDCHPLWKRPGTKHTGEIHAEPDERLRQCISQRQAWNFAIALTSLFAHWVRVVDI